MSYPALNGEPVTEGHARYCQESGHATHTVDGVTTGRCPRCGDQSAPNLPFYGNPIDTPVNHKWMGYEMAEKKKKYSVVVRASFLGAWHEVEEADTLVEAKAGARVNWLAGNYETRVVDNDTGEYVGFANGF